MDICHKFPWINDKNMSIFWMSFECKMYQILLNFTGKLWMEMLIEAHYGRHYTNIDCLVELVNLIPVMELISGHSNKKSSLEVQAKTNKKKMNIWIWKWHISRLMVVWVCYLWSDHAETVLHNVKEE